MGGREWVSGREADAQSFVLIFETNGLPVLEYSKLPLPRGYHPFLPNSYYLRLGVNNGSKLSFGKNQIIETVSGRGEGVEGSVFVCSRPPREGVRGPSQRDINECVTCVE